MGEGSIDTVDYVPVLGDLPQHIHHVMELRLIEVGPVLEVVRELR